MRATRVKAIYLPKLMAGEWNATMNLTEAQAGSDVGAIRSKAEPNGDGTYAVTGQKIYISWGDNDFTENTVHLVLARLPDAPKGTKGISLFLVPKRLPDADGNAGVANALKVVSLEHKLGLHGSPTCVMQYDGATGWLVGGAPWRHGRDVHDDEQRAPRCGRSRAGRGRGGLSARAGLCDGSRAGRTPMGTARARSSTMPMCGGC
jgi:acyl-CoA dehydrogenase